MTHSLNWSTIGTVQTSVLQTRIGWKREGPPPHPLLPERFLPSPHLGAWQPPQREEGSRRSVVLISLSLNKYPERLLCPKP